MDTTKFSKTPNIIESTSDSTTIVGTPQIRGLSEKKSLRDIFLEDEDFEDAEVFYPSKMNQDNPSILESKEVETKDLVQPFLMPIISQNEVQATPINTTPNVLAEKKDYEPSPFILANTEEVSLQHLKHDCIIPVFSKDNEKTIAHQEFIESLLKPPIIY